MGAIAAVFSKKDEDATSPVSAMLEELKHRGTKPPIVVSQPLTFIAQSSKGKTKGEKAFSRVALGVNGSEPILGEDYMMAFEGQFFPSTSALVHRVMHEMAKNPAEKARLILKKLEGSYTFAIAFTDRILVGRDSMGTKPLYYGENQHTYAVATERKALWKIGIPIVHSFPPGNLAILNETGFAFEAVAVQKRPVQQKIEMIDAAVLLQKLLEEATRERVSNVKKVGVAFSGGLDSSVVAVLAKLSGVEAHLICVGLEGQREIDGAEEAAENLDLPLTIQRYKVADVEDVLPKVLWLIDESDVMKAGVAIPFFWTAEIASRLGCRVLLAGQGADELFGGYRRYLTEYAKGGVERVREALFHDTVMSYETNFQRDEPVCAYHRVDLRLIFADTGVVRFALSLPVNLKVESVEDSLRKRVLRQVAKNLGIPAFIADKPKKAVQFATGVDKALGKLAKTKRLTKRSYVNRVFRDVYPGVEVKNG